MTVGIFFRFNVSQTVPTNQTQCSKTGVDMLQQHAEDGDGNGYSVKIPGLRWVWKVEIGFMQGFLGIIKVLIVVGVPSAVSLSVHTSERSLSARSYAKGLKPDSLNKITTSQTACHTTLEMPVVVLWQCASYTYN